ncbi:MAG: FAD-binding oxidoreductase [Nitrospiraceae bacterium]
MLTQLASFDGQESVRGELVRPDRYRLLFDALQCQSVIARGAGLSYCGAGAGSGVRSVSTLLFDRILEFDSKAGRLVAEPGLRIGDLVQFAVSRGWCPRVLPGHPMITIGGCVAFNVHGKSQYHDGNFIDCVESLVLYHPDHGEISCSREIEPELFQLTLGGFGLTGFITALSLRLDPLKGRSVLRKSIPVHNLLEAVQLLEAHCSDSDSIYSWNDLNRRGPSFGRGIVYVEHFRPETVEDRGRFRQLDPQTRGRLGIRFFNRWTTGLVTRTYGLFEARRPRESLLNLKAAAFPINGWEIYYAMFGKAGFREYQMLVPRSEWESTVKDVERLLVNSGVPATLGSLKLFAGDTTLLNFSGSGICLTIDVPATKESLDLFARLDDLTLGVGGIVNLSKDSRLSAELVRRIFPEYEKFKKQLQSLDPKRRFDSALRRRILV